MNRLKKSLEGQVLYIFIAIVLGFAVGALFLLFAGISPTEAYGKLVDSVFGETKYLFWALTYASPLIFTGLSVAFSFKTGVFNIGAEGQFVVGALVATVLGIKLDLPPVIHAIVCILAAAIAGGLWSFLVGLMKIKRGIHEVLSFIMFNWIAYYFSNYVVNLPGIHKQGVEATENVKDSARILFPMSARISIGCSALNFGIILAIVSAIVIYIIIEKTTLGYKLKATGFNKNAALYGGINSNKSILTALTISGVLAGLGGAVQILGMAGRLSQFAKQEGFGFNGITVALIATSNPIGCIFAGIFYGAISYGGTKLNIVNTPSEVINIIMGCIVIFIACAVVFKRLFLNIRAKKEKKKDLVAKKEVV